jgi:hypothetical protein
MEAGSKQQGPRRADTQRWPVLNRAEQQQQPTFLPTRLTVPVIMLQYKA